MGSLTIDRAELYPELGWISVHVDVGRRYTRFVPSIDTIQTILDDIITQTCRTLVRRWPWLVKLSEPRQRAVLWLFLDCDYRQVIFPDDVMYELERRCYHCAAQRLHAIHANPRLIDLIE